MLLQFLFVTAAALEHEGIERQFYEVSITKVLNSKGISQIPIDQQESGFVRRNLRHSANDIWIDDKEFVEPRIRHRFDRLENLTNDQDVKEDEESSHEEELSSESSEKAEHISPEEDDLIHQFDVSVDYDSDESTEEDSECHDSQEEEIDDETEGNMETPNRSSVFKTISEILIKEKKKISNS